MATPDETRCPYCGDEMQPESNGEFLYCVGCDHYSDGDCDCEGCESQAADGDG